MTQNRKKVKKNHPEQRDNQQKQSNKGASGRGSIPLTPEKAALLNQLVNNLQELHSWEGTILQKLGKIIDTLG